MEALYTALPEKSYTTLLVVFFLMLFFIVFTVLVQTNKVKAIKGAYKQLSFLLCALLALLFFVTTLLTTWNLYRIQPITLYEDHLECYQGNVLYKDILRAGIYTDKQQSFVDPNLAIGKSKMLVLERRGKQASIFSETYYDIEVLVKKIRERMEK